MQQPPAKKVSPADLAFIEARAKLIDVAAFFDRAERLGAESDFRVQALKLSVRELLSDTPGRARRILEGLSDHTTEPIAVATTQGASGAPGK